MKEMDEQMIKVFKELFTSILEKQLDKEVFIWLKSHGAHPSDLQFNMAFASMPRKTGKKELDSFLPEVIKAGELMPGFSLRGWTVDRLGRVWLLMQLDVSDRQHYINKINDLFGFGEMNELVALYSALPFFAYPEEWIFRCSEGVRNNMGVVQEAVMYHNPYPSKYLDESAWNQLIMKAFFGDKDVRLITGLDERANKNLAKIIVDYIDERWAAHRTANPQLWRLIAKFIDAANFSMIEKFMGDDDSVNQKAAALACFDSSYEPAKKLLHPHPELESEIENNQLDWNSLSDLL
ncbi:MAG: EboA domain-containing protein [Ginsengibacter sp.]